jgi:catechol 2,3-dioxygenase-like lactoylglutathione lyase family enzyme
LSGSKENLTSTNGYTRNAMSVSAFDHVAIPTANPEAMLRFYRALGFAVPDSAEWLSSGQRAFSIQFGEQKINVHAPDLWQDRAFTLRGRSAQPGCGDFCFVWSGEADTLREVLVQAGAPIEQGPVERLGARGGGTTLGSSFYTRDPDGNLLEFIVYR